MYDTITSQFQDAMDRESKTINSYTNNTAYSVLFRKNSDKNSMQDKLTIFYPVLQTISQGELLNYKTKTYIVLNNETAENEVYYKSDLLETNAKINYIVNGAETYIPIYAYDIQSPMAISTSTISVVSGNIHMITEYNATSKQLEISNTFTSMGRTWQIQNIIIKDNIVHLYCEVEASSTDKYAVSISGNDTYGINTTSKLTAIAKCGDTVITNASIIWTSSNTDIATIDNNGNASFKASGSVVFTALWIEHNVSATKQVNINSYSVIITANDTYSTSDTPILVATAKTNDVVDTTATFTWASSDATKATVDSAGKVKFLEAGNVTFTATWTQQNAIGTKQVTITQAVITKQYTCKIANTLATPTIYSDTNIPTIKTGGSTRSFVPKFYDATGTEVTTLTPVWTIDMSSLTTAQQAEITFVSSVSSYPLRCSLTAADDSSLLGKSIKLTLVDSGNLCTPYTIPVNIISLYG